MQGYIDLNHDIHIRLITAVYQSFFLILKRVERASTDAAREVFGNNYQSVLEQVHVDDDALVEGKPSIQGLICHLLPVVLLPRLSHCQSGPFQLIYTHTPHFPSPQQLPPPPHPPTIDEGLRNFPNLQKNALFPPKPRKIYS